MDSLNGCMSVIDVDYDGFSMSDCHDFSIDNDDSVNYDDDLLNGKNYVEPLSILSTFKITTYIVNQLGIVRQYRVFIDFKWLPNLAYFRFPGIGKISLDTRYEAFMLACMLSKEDKLYYIRQFIWICVLGIVGFVCEFIPSHSTPFIEGDYSISHSCGNTIRCIPLFFLIIVLYLYFSTTLLLSL